MFDPDKLAWMNRHYLKEAEPARVAALLVPHLQDAGVLSASVTGDAAMLSFLTACVPLIAGTVDRLADAPERLRPVFETPRRARPRTPRGRGPGNGRRWSRRRGRIRAGAERTAPAHAGDLP